jgi:hypothetical protein
VTRLHEGVERSYGRLGRTEEREAHLQARKEVESVGVVAGDLKTALAQELFRLLALIIVQAFKK